MPSLPPWLDVVLALLFGTGVGGGGLYAWLLKYKRYEIDQTESDAQVGRNLRDELRREIDDLADRQDKLEGQLSNERQRRIEAERRHRDAAWNAEILRRKVNLLIQMVNDLRTDAGMEPIEVDDLPAHDTSPTRPQSAEDAANRMDA